MLRTRSPRKEKISNCYLHSNSLSNKMDNSLLAVRDINHKYIVVEGIIYYQNILPSLHEEIALDTGEKPALVKLTISALCQYHAAVFLDDQSLQLLYL